MKVRMGPFYLPSKVKVITGDMSLLGLGLTIEDRQRLVNNVHIIYNFSAVVRFNEPLKKAILTNTRGTREMLNLARQCKSLEVNFNLNGHLFFTKKLNGKISAIRSFVNCICIPQSKSVKRGTLRSTSRTS